MTLRFTKATRATGVDGNFYDSNPRVLVKSGEFPAPLYPEDPLFWGQMHEVIQEVCAARDKANYSLRFSGPLRSKGNKTAADAARLVHQDWPGDVLLIAAKAVTHQGFRTFTRTTASNFTDGVVLLNHLVNKAPWIVSPSSFCAKWQFMVPRPEEVAGAIARGQITAPDWIMHGLRNMMDLSVIAADQRKFTMYPEGSPKHPSYSAMHAAAGGAAATIIKTMLALDSESTHAVNVTAENMAHFRATAGVHYPRDNAVGLWLGQETVARWLPQYLHDELGFDIDEVANAIASVRCDWGVGL